MAGTRGRLACRVTAGMFAACLALLAACGRQKNAASAPARIGGAPQPLFTCREPASPPRECGAAGKFIVDGDVGLPDVKLLREFAADRDRAARDALARPPPTVPLARTGILWTAERQRALTYCVGKAFGAQHDKVVADMEAATGAWEQAAAVDFRHDAAQDADCGAGNEAVLFDVNPVDMGGAYLVRAFAPGETRAGRNVYVDLSGLSLDPGQALQLSGLLRHALGHVLGFAHASVESPASPCSDAAPADTRSIMSRLPCADGTGGKWLLSERDRNGVACEYGPADGFTVDPRVCTPRPRLPPSTGIPVVKALTGQSVASGGIVDHGAFAAQAGSVVHVEMRASGADSGDPDLYVSLGRKPDIEARVFACRPFLTGAAESCELDAGAAPATVHVLVHGYAAGHYDLDVSVVPPERDAGL